MMILPNCVCRHSLTIAGILLYALVGAAVQAAERQDSKALERPNIVIILADDLGYGDLKCYNKDCLILTPNLDKLASSGIRFTNGHTSSSVCTPTRYSLLTGRYNWRSYHKNHVAGTFSKPLIEDGRTTIASLLKERNYATGIIGKWHLGLGWRNHKNELVYGGIGDEIDKLDVDYKREIEGPLNNGFDYYYGIAASLNMSPYCFIRNKHMVGELTRLPTDKTKLAEAYPKVYKMMPLGGHIAKDFDFEKVMDKLTDDAKSFIAGKANKEKPFFLYFPLTAPHIPVSPAERFWDKGGVGPMKHKHHRGYADLVYQVDDCVGEVVKALEEQGILDNTLIFFMADNGASAKACNYGVMLKKTGHDPSGGLKGTKGSIYEGGHRVPFIVSWKGKTNGQINDNLVGITDVFATVADLVGYKVASDAGEDSVSFLPYLGGGSTALREDLVYHSVAGDLAITKGRNKLVFSKTHGSWGAHHEIRKNPDLPKFQLYDLDADPKETTNLYREDADAETLVIVHNLQKTLQQYILKGRSTPGEEQKNFGDRVLFNNSYKVFEISDFNKRQLDRHTKEYVLEHYTSEGE
ncbi:MAG: arylsulfatase A [Rhodothermales bacterium]|jgi:arylsulfatase A